MKLSVGQTFLSVIDDEVAQASLPVNVREFGDFENLSHQWDLKQSIGQASLSVIDDEVAQASLPVEFVAVP